MQIHELTKKKNTQVDEGIGSAIGGAAASGVNALKNVGNAVASPFKDVAQSYKSGRQDQQVGATADKAFRVWQNYVAQLEQSIAKQPATATAGKPPAAPNTMANAPVSATNTAVPTNPNASAVTPGAPPAATKPNYAAQTGSGAKVTYNQPTGIPNPNVQQPTNAIGPKTPGVTVSTPATVASTAQGQPITGGGQKLKPGTKEYDQIAKATLKELQAPAAAVSPALAAFRDRSDGKYETYLKAFVQKNLLSGMGYRGLVNSAEIDNAIKTISKPENTDPAKQKPLWTDLVRACALATPAAGALTGRDPKASPNSNTPVAAKTGEDPNASPNSNTPVAAKTGEDPNAPAKPTMTGDQISQWISRNSGDHATLKAALAAINSAGKV